MTLAALRGAIDGAAAVSPGCIEAAALCRLMSDMMRKTQQVVRKTQQAMIKTASDNSIIGIEET